MEAVSHSMKRVSYRNYSLEGVNYFLNGGGESLNEEGELPYLLIGGGELLSQWRR